MKRAVLERLAAVLVVAAFFCGVCFPLVVAGVAAAALWVGLANSHALVNLRKKERPPVLRTPNGPKKKVDPPLL